MPLRPSWAMERDPMPGWCDLEKVTNPPAGHHPGLLIVSSLRFSAGVGAQLGLVDREEFVVLLLGQHIGEQGIADGVPE